MLLAIPLAGLNHLLASEDWARAHLKSFAGQTTRLELPPVDLLLEITSEGFFRSADDNIAATVTISLPADTPFRVLTGFGDRSSLLAAAQVRGSADLADCLGFVFRNLDWDAESDLAPLVGDIAARRLVQCVRQFGVWKRSQGWNLARNLAEFLTEELPIIARHQEISEFCREVECVSARMTSIERRIASMENHGQPR